MNEFPDSVIVRLEAVRRIVRERTGVDLAPSQIAEVHLRSLEPTILAKAIVFGLTGMPVEFGDGFDEMGDETSRSGADHQASSAVSSFDVRQELSSSAQANGTISNRSS